MTTPPDSTYSLLGSKTFNPADQLLFAKASGDYNPMHVDAIAARRLMAGRQVVHGIHVFFSALESLLEYDAPPSVARLDCTFINPVCVGDPVQFRHREGSTGDSLLEAAVNDLVCVQATISTANAGSDSGQTRGVSIAQAEILPVVLEPLVRPLTDDPSLHLNKVYRIDLASRELAGLFPRSSQFLGGEAAAGIASLSYFIGMVCPGLHSVFSSFTCRLRLETKSLPYMDFLVSKYDGRFRLVDVAFRGPIEGNMKAFLRPPPQRQETVDELTKFVKPDEFAETRSLIIGGSRGLGELTAKLLAAGGGKVEITYASGLEDARRVQYEVTASGKGECAITKLDLATDNVDTCGLTHGAPNLVFFYATPHIFRKKATHFDEEVFRDFCFFYVDRFFALCTYLENQSNEDGAIVYLPSTVAITDRPRGMAEYAMAKAAAEILAEEINKNFRNVRVVSTRLPRLNTDQTATIFGAAAESNVGTLLPSIRSMLATKHRATTDQ